MIAFQLNEIKNLRIHFVARPRIMVKVFNSPSSP
eukprot:COSAG06_NODE_56123_length_286_cov_0.834225_2_plen_33_part_01